ncbi:hypothetical protein MA16_Dca013185 [Dendrobium catenatum]|uniref:Uncharacterized protein n=1 Tax=Dendrobium catenatum TaxID=906689 RepID=A0A2I0WR39_9ASPA|nr:hypothetical protein MA16_Dca013185 [Dendrobium catenatum]
MGTVFTPVSSFLLMAINNFDILSMDNDYKVEYGVNKEKLSDNGIEGVASVVDDVVLWKDDGCGGRNCSNKFDCGVVKEIGKIGEMTKFKLAKELKSLGPIKNVPRGRNLEVGSKKRDGASSPRVI